MELPVFLQGQQFAVAGLLGLVWGLLYDFLRGFRRTLPGLTWLCDFVYGILILLGNLLLALYVGAGSFRIFFLVAELCGLVLWFLLLSRPILFVFCKFWAFLLLPFRFLWQFFKKILKKFQNFFKKTFSNRKKSGTIKERQSRKGGSHGVGA